MDRKLSGSYYTPQKTVSFIYNYVYEYKKSIKSVLEPSAGDGRFIEKLLQSVTVEKIVGIELYSSKAEDISRRILSPKVKVIASDFLDFYEKNTEKYDLVVGNPPYINIKNIDKIFLDSARRLCNSLELPESMIQNAWVAFVLASTICITENGAVFFVLPTEFLQVQYAEKLRGFLEKKFNTIHIITFEERMFPEIEQEACLVFLTNEKQGLSYISYKQYAKLDARKPSLVSRIERNKPLKKWSNAILSDEEIDLLNKMVGRYRKIGDMAETAPGIVTGANNKFILTQEEVRQYQCDEYVDSIISKGVMAKNKFEINQELISTLASEGQKVYLLNLQGFKDTDLPDPLQKYLLEVAKTKRGAIEIQNSYKCSRRKPWYAVPIVKCGEVVFFKRYDECPRISTNPEQIYTTDIAYNLRLHKDIDPDSLVFCFYNSMTLAQCEFVGRYYAGGVSELTPTEFRVLSIPYRRIEKTFIDELKKMFKENQPLKSIVGYVNSKTIGQDFRDDDIQRMDNIREKLIKRRK